jgi:hypothetical protein
MASNTGVSADENNIVAVVNADLGRQASALRIVDQLLLSEKELDVLTHLALGVG